MSDHSEQLAAVHARLGGLVRRDVSLAPLCTYKVGGPAALYAVADSVGELHRIADAMSDVDLPTLVLGKGSNLLVSDAGFGGMVIKLGDAFDSIEIDPSAGSARLGGAALLPVAARKTATAGLTGFEWAVGVPGSAGGAVRMNAGGHGSDIAATLVRASVFDLSRRRPEERTADQLDLGYRRSSIGSSDVVLYAELALEPGDPSRSEAEIAEIVRWRRANQPGGQNAGSVFTNPPDDSAGRLIEAAGLKGFRIGTAEVSTKHANFIQADPGGAADDVARVIDAVRTRVEETYGVLLHCENLLVGFDDRPGPGRRPSARRPKEVGQDGGAP